MQGLSRKNYNLSLIPNRKSPNHHRRCSYEVLYSHLLLISFSLHINTSTKAFRGVNDQDPSSVYFIDFWMCVYLCVHACVHVWLWLMLVIWRITITIAPSFKRKEKTLPISLLFVLTSILGLSIIINISGLEFPKENALSMDSTLNNLENLYYFLKWYSLVCNKFYIIL